MKFTRTKYINAATMTGTAVVTGDDIEMSEWEGITFHAVWTSTAVGTFTVQLSDDSTTWRTVNAVVPTQPNGAASDTHIHVEGTARYARLVYTNASSTGVLTVSYTQHQGGAVTVGRVIIPGQVVAGQNTDIDASAEQIVTASTPLLSGVWIKALPGNSDQVYVGTSGVTASTGYPLDADQFVFIEIDNLNKVYAIGGAANQGVAYFGS